MVPHGHVTGQLGCQAVNEDESATSWIGFALREGTSHDLFGSQPLMELYGHLTRWRLFLGGGVELAVRHEHARLLLVDRGFHSGET